MDCLPVKDIRVLEKTARDLGLDERVLIENASSNLFSVIDALSLGKKALIIAGRGNNGADVLSCARKFLSRGYDVKAAVLEDKPLYAEACFQKKLLEDINADLYSVNACNLEVLERLLSEQCFVLEGILGIGIKNKVSPFCEKVISLINKSGKKVVSCDIPSGLDPDAGIVLGEAVKADYTVTFISPKQGFFINQGVSFCGKIYAVDIGISRERLEAVLRKKNALK